jgi:hypothetical protein
VEPALLAATTGASASFAERVEWHRANTANFLQPVYRPHPESARATLQTPPQRLLRRTAAMTPRSHRPPQHQLPVPLPHPHSHRTSSLSPPAMLSPTPPTEGAADGLVPSPPSQASARTDRKSRGRVSWGQRAETGTDGGSAASHISSSAGLYDSLRQVQHGKAAVAGAHNRAAEWRDDDLDAWELVFESWLGEYQREQASFPSLLLYTQMKLQETLGSTQTTTAGPDAFRVAVACKLHEQLVHNVFGRYKEVMAVLHSEMMRGIYPATHHHDSAGGAVPSVWKRARELAVGSRRPFFMENGQLRRRNNYLQTALTMQREKDNFVREHIIRRRHIVTLTVRSWFEKCVRHMFVRWRWQAQTSSHNRLRQTAIHIVDRMSRSKFMLRLIMRWSSYAVWSRGRRYQNFCTAVLGAEHSMAALEHLGNETDEELTARVRLHDTGYQELRRQLRRQQAETARHRAGQQQLLKLLAET